ncbi:MAG: T9SS type A sorting domain-containing protein [Bacteroidales bacterium]|nr:T9SS type A sorting domain-containing protein [Bacteroidales bacterium]
MNKLKISISIIVTIIITSYFSYNICAGDVVGKVTVGYQGWFACPDDGSPIDMWWHWSTSWSQPPSPSTNGMISWPEVSGYTTTFQTNFSNLGNGQPATVFSSYTDQTINTHFLWMAQNEIDCAALQRFSPYGIEGPTRDDMAEKVKDAAETNGVKFYIMYDVTGWTNMQSEIKEDWTNKMSAYTSSTAYAYEDGKPVVVIWGFGFSDPNRPWDAETCLDVIAWFKGQGCYVGGGVPTHWRTETSDSRPDFLEVYHAFDMISPWMVGRIGNISGSDWFYENINLPDQADCDAHGIDYQPCVLPGDLQQEHRDNGDFMWRQFYNMISVGCQGIYISMFDEYNEANQILNTSDSYLSNPTNSDFKTTSSEGVYVSSDFYMRLTGEGGRMLKGIITLADTHSIPLQSAPMWYRSSFEPGFDALPAWTSTIDDEETITNVSSPVCELSEDKFYVGTTAIEISGDDNSSTGGSSAYFKVIDVDILVSSNTNLTYLFYPLNDLGRYISVDLIMEDATNLRDSDAEDHNSVSMHPSAGRGTVGTWNKVSCNIGSWLEGKTIDRILICYDHEPETGTFTAYIDNVIVYDGDMDTEALLPAFPYDPVPYNEQVFTNSAPEQLAWSADDLSQTFTIYLDDDIVLTDDDLINTQTDTFYILPRLKGNETYYWRVDQTTPDGTTMGPVWSFVTPDPYTDPVNPSPAHLSADVDTNVTFAWQAEIIDQTFNIYLGTEAVLTFTDLLSSQTDTFIYYPLLNTNKTYYWRVDQTSAYGTTTGPVWRFSTRNKPLQARYPRPIDGSLNRDINLELSWQIGSYVDSQNLYLGTSDNLDAEDLIGSPADGSYELTDLEYSTTYYWRVDGINDVGTTKGEVWNFTTKDDPDGIHTAEEGILITEVYPNPVTDGVFYIDFQDTFNGNIRLSDIHGKLLMSEEVAGKSIIEISVADIPPGLYFISIFDKEYILVRKIFIE